MEWVVLVVELLAAIAGAIWDTVLGFFAWLLPHLGTAIGWVLSAPAFAVMFWLWFLDIRSTNYWEFMPTEDVVLYAVGCHLTTPFSLMLYWSIVKAAWKSATNRETGPDAVDGKK